MARSGSKHFDKRNPVQALTLAKPLAPEDVQPGDFVALMHIIAELPSFLWQNDASTLPVHEPVRIQLLAPGAGVPLRVKSICLPFVLVKSPWGYKHSVDLRQCQLARLDRDFALVTWKAHQRARSRKQKSGAGEDACSIAN